MPSASTAEAAGSFAGIVLAGGASTRMGCDKALLQLDGRSLLARAVGLLQAAGAEPVVVSGARAGYDSVADAYPERGPLGGLASVLSARAALRERLLLVLPVDVPGLRVDDLHRLLRGARVHGAGAYFTDNPLPLALYADAGAHHLVETLLSDSGGQAAVHRLISGLALAQVPVDGADLRNLNTPAERQDFLGR